MMAVGGSPFAACGGMEWGDQGGFPRWELLGISQWDFLPWRCHSICSGWEWWLILV